MPDKVTVHLTMFEDPIEVPADELPVLRAQGLVRDEVPESPAAAPTTTAAKVTATRKDDSAS